MSLLQSTLVCTIITDEEIGLLDGEILVTQNAANVLGFAAGDQVRIQDLDLNQQEVTVSGLVRNYLGNNVYMTEKTYESLFGDYEPNGVFLKLSETCSDEITYADDLGGKEGVVSYSSKQELSDEFSDAFTLINMVVYIVIIMAAALAFVVLFTLSTTNISERSRELATIKVLGFFDREVHLYVNKETMILTAIGHCLRNPAGICVCADINVCFEHAVDLSGGVPSREKLCHGGWPLIFVCDPGGSADEPLPG